MSNRQRPLDDTARRLQAVLDNASVSIFLMDHRQHCVYMNRAAEALTGLTLGEVLDRDEPLHDIIHHHHPDGRAFPLSECAIDRVFPEHHQVTGEEVFVHKDGSFYPVSFTASPIHDDASNTIGTIIEVRSLAGERALREEHRIAEQKLHDAQALLHSIGESSADLIFAKDLDGRLLYANPATLTVLGRRADEVMGKSELEWHDNPEEARAIHETDLGVMRSGTVVRVDEPFTTPGGQQRIYRSTKGPLRDQHGVVIGLVGVTTDVTEQRHAEEQKAVLLHELRHRVKNTLATVQSLAFQSFREAAPDAFETFEGRLVALARAHNTLTDNVWQSASVRQVVETALEAFQVDGRIAAEGEECELPANVALTLALVLHELGTNACKYGALSGPAGRVTLRWSCERHDEHVDLFLRWAESGGPPVLPPKRRGFGSRLIERQVGGEAGGSSRLRFEPDGLIAEIDVRLLSATPADA